MINEFKRFGHLHKKNNESDNPKILTNKQIWAYWQKYSVPSPGNRDKWTLSTTGARKLILSCFSVENREPGMEKKKGHNSKPDYPFHLQPPGIQEMIVGLLDTNPSGKRFMNQLVEKLSGQLLLDAIQGENHG